jgi:RecJ-like exonuclease
MRDDDHGAICPDCRGTGDHPSEQGGCATCGGSGLSDDSAGLDLDAEDDNGDPNCPHNHVHELVPSIAFECGDCGRIFA